MATEQTHFDWTALKMPRCPHCNVADPLLSQVTSFPSTASDKRYNYRWKIYLCTRCGKPVIGGCRAENQIIEYIYPSQESVDADLPVKVGAFLKQAIEAIHAPSGSIMLCASAVDSMLKEKGLKQGGLYARIEEAVAKNLITPEMAKWAHEVRLDSNDERHADESAALPDENAARKCIEFTKALAEFLFILPGKIQRALGKTP